MRPENEDAAACLHLETGLVNIIGGLKESFPPNAPKSSTLILMNMLTPADLKTPEDVEDTLADCRIELEQHGTLQDLRIELPPTPEKTDVAPIAGMQPEDYFQPGVGFVYATFASVEEAEHVQKLLAGRKFNGRQVMTSIQMAK